jgi:hypothetical protein
MQENWKKIAEKANAFSENFQSSLKVSEKPKKAFKTWIKASSEAQKTDILKVQKSCFHNISMTDIDLRIFRWNEKFTIVKPQMKK